MTTALVTGSAGQDGVLLAARLRRLGQRVVCVVRPGSTAHPSLQAVGVDPSDIRAVDVCSADGLSAVVAHVRPDSCYHLAACHFAAEEQVDDAQAEACMTATNLSSTETLLRTIRDHAPHCRFVFAASSQMYSPDGQMGTVDETTPMTPASYYGLTKAWAREIVSYYRRHRNLFAATAILFNHESPLRAPKFVTRKLSRAAADAATGGKGRITLRSLEAYVDWSSAYDVVDGMHLMTTLDQPRDFVIASGTLHSVAELAAAAYGHVGLDWRQYVEASSRPVVSRATGLRGDAGALRAEGWTPQWSFDAMVADMVDHDMRILSESSALS